MTTAVGAAVCARRVAFTTEEIERLRALPDPQEPLEPAAWCDLEATHPGPHHGFAQIGATTWWWLRWDDTGAQRELIDAGFCGAHPSDGPGDCVLPREHPGRHSFELEHTD